MELTLVLKGNASMRCQPAYKSRKEKYERITNFQFRRVR